MQDETVPSFIPKRPEQQPTRPAGFDYDVLNAEVLLSRASAKQGRLALPVEEESQMNHCLIHSKTALAWGILVLVAGAQGEDAKTQVAGRFADHGSLVAETHGP